MATSKNMYELTYVISGVVKQNQVDDIVRKITQFVKDNGGEIEEVDEWGNQRLAYEIDKKRSGYYVNMYFRAPGDLIGKLERQLKINDDVLRFLTLRMDAKMQRHYQTQKGKEKRKAHSAQLEEAEAEADEEDDDEGDEDDE
jgi:small subunit ribosomal protein S6